MDAYELAKKYYPVYWSKERLKALVAKGKLTEAQFKDLTGEEYADGK